MKEQAPPPEPINIEALSKPPKINKRTRKGREQAKQPDIIPANKKGTSKRFNNRRLFKKSEYIKQVI